ncbi:MAG: Ig-like domain-containing protein [Ruminococcus sp.]|nr:Ig-like domain-containing protein [Ruminococcus sp.]
MQMKKSKTFLAAFLAAATACTALLPTAASAAGNRTEPEAYGDDTYAARFMSLYDDVITNGVDNGYMSKDSTVSGGLGVPYHSVEELCIEAPDYGHETTSEAMSYLVWVAAMRDNIVNDAKNGEITVKGEKDASTETVGDTAKAWLTMEATLVPDAQGKFMTMGSGLSATYSDEWQKVEDYPTNMASGNTAQNPIHQNFCNAYGNDGGLYLMNWLADVDDWYQFGTGVSSQYKQKNVSGSFTLINTFQRGEQESCWETIPHASVEELKFGVPGNGMKAFFNTESQVAKQFAYTNAPDAEDRAIQAVYAANRWGVGDQQVNSKWGGSQSLTQLAAKMGDECRNNMYDKYYKDLGCQQKWNTGGADKGKHYLMNWYTSWGGALDGTWAWQIGASHIHEFYQNPLAAYALAYDSNLSSAMKASGAVEDYKESFKRQMELYLWLLSNDGPIAGGCTNSWNGRYDEYPAGQKLFYDMAYVEHPVYADPGSNHWIGNQVWAMQRIAELYYVVKTEGDASGIQVGGMSLTEALETILDKWVGWFLDNTILGKANATKEFDALYEPYHTETTHFEVPDLTQGVTFDEENFSIPSSLIWEGQPNSDWNGTYVENTGLTCTIVGYGDGDLGCVSSLANTLLYYAKGKGVTGDDLTAGEESYKSAQGTKGGVDQYGVQALYLGKELIDRQWDKYRDNIGLGVEDHNTNLYRLWETKLALPDGTIANGEGQVLSASRYTGKMPNGDEIKAGVAFVDIRSRYEESTMYQTALNYYNGQGEDNDGDGTIGVGDYYFTLHRFWHAGDILMAIGAMYELYPELTPDQVASEDLTVDKESIEIGVGETETITPNKENCTFESADSSIATVDPSGVVTGVAGGSTTVTVTDADGNKVEVSVTVTEETTTTATTTTTTATTSDTVIVDGLIGDTNLDGKVSLVDVVYLNKYIAGSMNFNEQQMYNAQCVTDAEGRINSADATALLEFIIELIDTLPQTTE